MQDLNRPGAGSASPASRLDTLWARGFRPFFLLAGVWALALVPVWVAMLLGLLPAPFWLTPPWWHAHEMLFGFVSAAIAGFLTTSVPVWTGTRALAGGRLAALVGLWLAGRVAMALCGLLPAPLVAAVDVAFLPVLAAVLARPILARAQARNYGFVPILAALALANAAVHLQALGLGSGAAQVGLRAGVWLVALLIVVIGGRIVPAFTRNALANAGIAAPVRSRPALDRLAIAATLGFAVVDLAVPRSAWSGAAALLAALAIFARMAGWQTRRTTFEPLVWSLHVGYLWLSVGFASLALADLGGPLPWTSGLHALTVGAFGGMILAVTTRVALGHSGRALAAPRGIATAYGLVTLSALMRMLGPVVWPGAALQPIVVSGVLWAGAFAIFLRVYAPILTAPRTDGLPG